MGTARLTQSWMPSAEVISSQVAEAISQSDDSTSGFKPQRNIQPKSVSQRTRCLMGQSPTSSNNPKSGKVKVFHRDKYPVSVSTPPPRYSFKAPFTISSNAFSTQEWSNLARDDVWRLRKTTPLVSFFGWLRGLLIALLMEAARTSETFVNFYQTTRRFNPEDSHQLSKHYAFLEILCSCQYTEDNRLILNNRDTSCT
jgi:hypothetical protein